MVDAVIFQHQLELDLGVHKLLAQQDQGLIVDHIRGGVHQLLAPQRFQLVQTGLAHQHVHPGRNAVRLHLLQPQFVGSHAALDHVHAGLLAHALQFGLGLVDLVLLLLQLVFQRLHRALDLAPLLVQPVLAVYIRQLIRDPRGLGAILAIHADVNQAGVAIGIDAETVAQDQVGVVAAQRAAIRAIFRGPLLHQVQVLQHLVQEGLGLHDFELRLEEERVVAGRELALKTSMSSESSRTEIRAVDA
jgi:hypothetical protein